MEKLGRWTLRPPHQLVPPHALLRLKDHTMSSVVETSCGTKTSSTKKDSDTLLPHQDLEAESSQVSLLSMSSADNSQETKDCSRPTKSTLSQLTSTWTPPSQTTLDDSAHASYILPPTPGRHPVKALKLLPYLAAHTSTSTLDKTQVLEQSSKTNPRCCKSPTLIPCMESTHSLEEENLDLTQEPTAMEQSPSRPKVQKTKQSGTSLSQNSTSLQAPSRLPTSSTSLSSSRSISLLRDSDGEYQLPEQSTTGSRGVVWALTVWPEECSLQRLKSLLRPLVPLVQFLMMSSLDHSKDGKPHYHMMVEFKERQRRSVFG